MRSTSHQDVLISKTMRCIRVAIHKRLAAQSAANILPSSIHSHAPLSLSRSSIQHIYSFQIWMQEGRMSVMALFDIVSDPKLEACMIKNIAQFFSFSNRCNDYTLRIMSLEFPRAILEWRGLNLIYKKKGRLSPSFPQPESRDPSRNFSALITNPSASRPSAWSTSIPKSISK